MNACIHFVYWCMCARRPGNELCYVHECIAVCMCMCACVCVCAYVCVVVYIMYVHVCVTMSCSVVFAFGDSSVVSCCFIYYHQRESAGLIVFRATN